MGKHRKPRECICGEACHLPGQQQQKSGERSKLMMSIILQVDLRCCKGCRDWICRNLKGVDGVEEVKMEVEDKTVTVTGERLDEAEILRTVKKRKPRVEVLVPPLPQRGGDAACDDPHPLPASGDKIPLPGDPPPKPKHESPPPPPPPTPPTAPNRKPPLQRGDTLVTERLHDDIHGTKIRTRVTTTHDACTCIRYEESRFIIDRCTSHQPQPRTLRHLAPELNIPSCQNF